MEGRRGGAALLVLWGHDGPVPGGRRRPHAADVPALPGRPRPGSRPAAGRPPPGPSLPALDLCAVPLPGVLGPGAGGPHGPAAPRLDRDVRGPAAVPTPAAPGRLPPVGRSGLGRGLIVASLLPGGVARRRGLVGAVVDDLHDLDEAERGAEAAKGRLQLGVDLGHLAMMPAVSVAHSQRSDATRRLSGTLAAGEPAGGEYPSAAFGPLWGLLG